MKISTLSISTVLSLATTGIALAHQETDINLSEVPESVIQAAKDAKPGIKLTESERIDDNGVISYELEGRVGKEEFEILITEDGKLIGVELEDD